MEVNVEDSENSENFVFIVEIQQRDLAHVHLNFNSYNNGDLAHVNLNFNSYNNGVRYLLNYIAKQENDTEISEIDDE